jgi:nucleoside-diphosphate-sugar epimerase
MPSEWPIMKKSVGIIGCGWLGLPLGKTLGENGYVVAGSTTSPGRLDSLKQNGISPYLFSLSPDGDTSFVKELVPENGYVVVAVPPRLRQQEEGEYGKQIDQLCNFLKASSVAGIVFISTTSVYPELNRVVVEEDVQIPTDSPEPLLVEAENKMIGLRRAGKRVTIARMSGLMGYDRIPGKYVRGKQGLTTGDVRVNYIHRDDAVAVVRILIENGCPDETYNFCAPHHPERRAVYDLTCRQFGWEVPSYQTGKHQNDFKIIAAEKFSAHFAYSYKYSNPLEFDYELQALTTG